MCHLELRSKNLIVSDLKQNPSRGGWNLLGLIIPFYIPLQNRFIVCIHQIRPR